MCLCVLSLHLCHLPVGCWVFISFDLTKRFNVRDRWRTMFCVYVCVIFFPFFESYSSSERASPHNSLLRTVLMRSMNRHNRKSLRQFGYCSISIFPKNQSISEQTQTNERPDVDQRSPGRTGRSLILREKREKTIEA